MKEDSLAIKALMSDFPSEEYKARCKKASALMEQNKIDGFLLGKEENVAYFSGFRRPTSYQFVFMLLPKDDAPVLVASADQRGNVEGMSWVDDTRFYGPSSLRLSNAKETGLRLLKEAGLDKKVLGVESNPQVSDQNTWNALTKSVTRTVEVDDFIMELRMIKSSLELENVKKACSITATAFEEGLAAVDEGMTEKELARVVYKVMIEEGAEDTPLRGALNLRGGARRYAMFDTRPTDYKLQKGDTVILDGGTTYRGYWCDIARLASIGQPSNRQRQLFEACLEAEVAGLEALQPGRKISEVCQVVERILEKRRLAANKFPGEPFGHGVGLEIHEVPIIVPNSDRIIEPGMVFAIEPCLYDDPVMKSIIEKYRPGGEGVFFVEDNVLVTKTGPENLTPIPRDLHIV